MEEMPNGSETIERLAKEAERLRILLMAKECKDLDEFIQKLEAQVKVNE